MLPWRVGAGTIAPYQYRERVLLIESRQILRHENGVGLKGSLFLHDSLILTQSALFYDK